MNSNHVVKRQCATLPELIQHDVKRIQAIPIVQTILDVVCRTTEMGFAVLARVTDHYWVACATNDRIGFGLLPGEDLPLETTICQSIRQMGLPVVIESVEADPFYCSHQTPKIYGFQSYISVPVYRKGGELFGTLCAIDPEPKKIDCSGIREMFSLFADMIARQLDSSEKRTSNKGRQPLTLESGFILNQFIDVLHHDVKKPLDDIITSAEALQRMECENDVSDISERIRSSAFRISGSVENLLDINRRRLGDDLNISCCMVDHPGLCFSQVINDWQRVWPSRKIEASFNLSFPLFCDIARIRQLFSNLLGNALYSGDEQASIVIKAENRGTQFFLSVSNSVPGMPDVETQPLCQPVPRKGVEQSEHGSGLGMYVAHEIATAHHGGIYVESGDLTSRITFFMPVLQPSRSRDCDSSPMPEFFQG